MKVAVAIITDEQQRILITQRPLHVPHGGFWEFPGGKLEAGELPEHALIREIREEVGLQVIRYRYLGIIDHEYPGKSIQLIIFHVIEFSGKPSCLEGQLDIKWMKREDLHLFDFPEANRRVLDLLTESLIVDSASEEN